MAESADGSTAMRFARLYEWRHRTCSVSLVCESSSSARFSQTAAVSVTAVPALVASRRLTLVSRRQFDVFPVLQLLLPSHRLVDSHCELNSVHI